MTDEQNPGTEEQQPEKENIPEGSAAEETPAGYEPPKTAEEAGPVSESPEGAWEEPAVPETAETPVPSVEEPVYPQQTPAAEDTSTTPVFQAVPPEEPVGQHAGFPGSTAPEQSPQPWPQGPQAAPEFIPPVQQNWYPQGSPVYQQPPYSPAGYGPYQQPQQGPGFYPPVPAQQGQAYYHPAASQQSYYAPPAGWGYPAPPQGYTGYGMPPAPPKKKMSVGLKVFIWVASILAAAAILGFGGYLVYHAVLGQASQDFRGNLPYDYQIPELPRGGGDDGTPDFDDGVEPPEADENTQPDVDVTPNTDGITIKEKPAGEELSAQEVYEKVVKSTVTVAVTLNRDGQEQNSTGTGIVATSDGYIITNSHVVLNSKSSIVEITTYDGQQYDAVVVGVDRTTDLAVLKTNDYGFTPAEFGDSAQLSIGESVVAIGNPGGAKFSGSMTGGYVSGLNREVGRYSENGMTYIQTDAAINPGNSGGPLVNMCGQVVGINSSKIITDGYEGMGFAIPVSEAKSVIDVLLSGGYVKGRTRLGITGTEISEMQSAVYGVPRGFAITEFDGESAFTGTDAQTGDIITAIDGDTVTGLSDISNLLTRYAPGDTVTITLYRRGQGAIEVEATLLEDRGETQK